MNTETIKQYLELRLEKLKFNENKSDMQNGLISAKRDEIRSLLDFIKQNENK